jgi:hypothetical protein
VLAHAILKTEQNSDNFMLAVWLGDNLCNVLDFCSWWRFSALISPVHKVPFGGWLFLFDGKSWMVEGQRQGVPSVYKTG